MLFTVLAGVVTVLGLAYLYIRKKYAYWTDRGVPSLPANFPMGNFEGLGTTHHITEIIKKLYDAVKDKGPFAGIYLFTHPTAIITDLELVKNVLIKDFDHFRNRNFYYNEKDDPLSANIFTVPDKKWKDVRAKLTPTFTSGKMKMMFGTVLEIANAMVSTVDKLVDDGADLDVKDMMSRYSTDVIGSCAFGINCNSLINPQAEFRTKGRMFLEPTRFEMAQQVFGSAFPSIARKLGLRLVRKELSDFFIDAVMETVTFRRINKVERKDFMQLLLEIQKKDANTGQQFTDMDIAGQAFLFFIAGFETSSSATSFALFELAQNHDLQKRLRNEINEVLHKHNDEITYEAINEMPYLDQVINETLRKYSIDTLIRKTERDYNVPGTKHVIEKGTNVIIPLFAIQHDPKLYPDPEKFDPERFTPENVAQRHPMSYLPFGEGPRICIGARFGIMQTRLGVLSIIRNFHITTRPDLPNPLVFKKVPQVLIPVQPIMLKIDRV